MKKQFSVIRSLSLTVKLLLTAIVLYSCTAKPPSTATDNTSSTKNSGTAKNTGTLSTPEPESASAAPGLEKSIMQYINQHRQSKGLPELIFNGYVAAEARNHSLNMARKLAPFGHQGLPARTKKISQKITGITSVSENVAHGKLTAKQVVDSWLGSPGHRRNIEGNFKYTGIGVARDQHSELYFTQIFAR